MDEFRPTRRGVLGGAGLIAGGLLVGPGVAACTPSDPGTGTGAGVVLAEGTNVCAAASPDGSRVAIDLLTVLWTLPIAGGEAVRLTDDLGDATQPRWSPDGARLVFQSYRDGNYHLWTAAPDGSDLRQLTSGRFDHREPAFSPDGATVACASDRGGTGSYGIHLLDVASGQLRALTDTAAEESQPAFTADGAAVLCTVDQATIAAVDVATGAVMTVVTAPEGATLFGPAPSPDGARLAYVRITGAVAELVVDDAVVSQDGEDVFGFAPTWLSPTELLYTADGLVKRRALDGSVAVAVPFTASVEVPARAEYRRSIRDVDSTGPRGALGIASPVASLDGTRIAFRALGALYLLTVGDPVPQVLVADGYVASDPDFAPDGRSIVFASDRAGEMDLWLRDLETGTERRLTAGPGAQIAPRFSPDGTRIAYADQNGVTSVLDLRTGAATAVTPPLFQPGRASWSADGATLALAAVKPFSKRFREGTSQILTVRLADNQLTYTEPEPFGSLATRGDDGPVFSPDGTRLAFVVGSTLRVVAVDAAGAFTGEVAQVTDEVTDSPAWIGPDRLLYLNHGRLRTVEVGTRRTEDVPLALDWSPAQVAEPTVLHVGALWDGRSEQLRRDVDLIVSGGRIEAVEDYDPARPGVDARELTAMPGLVDAHVHWHLRGRQWGDRQGRLWLAYGITSVRSPGDPAYQFVETREALESGGRIGPRLFGTGEAVDGGRVYYNFMRPTLARDQLARELERATRLGYDMIKTYVRLPVEFQADMVEQAHAAGLPLASHYLYPAMRIGMDGMEHTGATNRLGYSHTVSRLGRAYADAVTLFVESGMSLTPTLFNSAALYVTDRSLVDDPRSSTLFPPWEYAQLQAKAAGQGPPGTGTPETQAALLASNVDMVLRVHLGGGFVIAGTDAPLDSVAVSLHYNLRAMVAGGFTPFEALTTATANPARWLGLEDRIGALVPGAFADVALVRGDPLADIAAAAAVERVLTNGTLRSVDELLAPFAAPAAAAVPPDAVLVPAGLGAGGFTVRFADGGRADARGEWWHRPEWSEHVCCSV